MAYLYAWYGNDDDLFYIGFSSGDSKTHTRARRMVGVCYTNRQLSRAEAYFYDRNRRQFQTTVRIIKEGLNDSEALLLESALIIKYKSILLNSNHLNLNMFDTKEVPEDIFDLADSLLCKIRAGEITHTSKTIIWQKPKLLYIEYEDRYDIISTKSFFFQYGMSVRDFLKYHDPKHYKMKEIGIEYEDVILYYDKLRF